MYGAGATDPNDRRATFSNYGACTTFFAPGVAIEAAGLGDTVAIKSGTSMATPVIAGLFLQGLQKYNSDRHKTTTNFKYITNIVQDSRAVFENRLALIPGNETLSPTPSPTLSKPLLKKNGRSYPYILLNQAIPDVIGRVRYISSLCSRRRRRRIRKVTPIVILRGRCSKIAEYAQKRGAKAVLLINNVNSLQNVTIPVAKISRRTARSLLRYKRRLAIWK